MKKALTIIVLLLLSIHLNTQPKFSFKISPLEVKKISGSRYSLNFSVRYSGITKELFEDAKVSIPIEKFIVTGIAPENKIVEKDFLYANFSYDLNNDNDLNDTYQVKIIGNKYYINTTEIKSVLSPVKYSNFSVFHYYNEDGSLRTNKIGKNGLEFILYSISKKNKMVYLGLGTKEKPVKIEEFPNPNIQILLIKESDSFKSGIKYSVGKEKNFYAYSNEQIIKDQEGDWYGIAYTLNPLVINSSNITSFNLSLNNISPPFAVIVYVNMALEKGLRLRTVPSSIIMK